MVRLLVLALALSGVAAFVPARPMRAGVASIRSTETEEGMDLDLADMQELFDAAAESDGGAAAAAVPTLNGWKPDRDAFCWGLPGSLSPVRDFDPLGFAQAGIPLSDVKRYREAEVQHGRVAMMAAVGYLAGEAASPIVWHGEVGGPANDQLAQIPAPAFAVLSLVIGAAEYKRARIGWVEPTNFDALFELREGYYPGDLGFDPLGLKPAGAADFASMATKELQNGRLAMLGVAGMCAQELVNHKTIFETIDFYQKVYP